MRNKNGKRGGVNKMIVRNLKEEIQFFYIFKEIQFQRCSNVIKLEIEQTYARERYESLKREKKAGDYEKCLRFIDDQSPHIHYNEIGITKITEGVLSFFEAEGKTLRTLGFIERYVSYYLSKKFPRLLAKNYASKMIQKYYCDY